MYRTWFEINHDGGRREVVVAYEGESRRRAVQAYNDIATFASKSSSINSFGWQVAS